MKPYRWCVPLFALLLLLLFSISSFADRAIFDPTVQIKARKQVLSEAWLFEAEAAASQKQYAKMGRFLSRQKSAKGSNFEVIETHVEFDANEAAGTIDTESTITIQALEDNVTTIELTIQKLDTFRIEDELGTELSYDYDSYYGVLEVTLQTPLNISDGQVDLVVYNSGDPECAPDDFFGMLFCSVSEEIVFFTSSDWVPTRAAYTYEEYFDNGPIDIDITTPAGYIAATTSDPVGDPDDLGDSLIYHFEGNFDVTYFGMAYAQYDTFDSALQTGSPVTAYIHTGTTDYGQVWADTSADILDFYEDIYSPYIYNKHDVIQTIEELGGGVGPQSATFYYAGALNTSPDYWTSESLFSHEIAHQWWANMVRMGDNISPWLNEGFAEYSSRLYGYTWWSEYYQDYLYSVYFMYFQAMVDPQDEVPMSSSGIFSADSMTYQAVTYWKGSHFLRMLEWYLGYDDFIAAMSAYANTYSSNVTDELVTVDKFKTLLETQTGVDLEDFFQRWVYSAGYPEYYWAAEFGQSKAGYTVRVKIDQVQDSETVYEIPIGVDIWHGENTEPEEFVMTFDGKTADQTFTFDDEPRGIQVDSRSWIWGEKTPALAGDVDGSNDVDGRDLIYVAWCQGGEAMSGDAWNFISEADFNNDRIIDQEDYDLLYENFGKKGTIDE